MKKFLSLLIILLLVVLVACTPSTAEEATAVSTPDTLQPTSTAPPDPTKEVATIAPAPATVTAVATEPGLPQPPIEPAADTVTFSSDGHIAFVQDDVLYIQDLARANPPILIDSCAGAEFCGHYYLKWSPDGQYLLYYRTENFESDEIRLATPQGEWQTIGTEAHFFHPATWSPDGNSIVYLRDTGEMVEDEVVDQTSGDTITMPLPVLEVITIKLQDGLIASTHLNGILKLQPPGCGGGGRSPSEVLYENEGGTAYGYIMGVLEWTAQDVLLFTTNCTNVGIGRYDLANATQLEPFEMPLRNLVLSPDKSRWYAVSGNTWSSEPGNNEVVTGDPEDTAVTTIPTSQSVEMLFIGEQSGQIYITSRNLIMEDSTDNTMGGSFRFYETTLWQLDAEGGAETAVYQADDHAIARVQEAPDGTLLFVRIENDIPLMEAINAGAPQERWPEYSPKRHIVALDEVGELRYLVPNAGSLAVTP